MTLALFLFYGAMMIFRWAGVGLVERQQANDNTLRQPVQEDWVNIDLGPISQVDPNFYKMRRLNAVFGDNQ